MPERMSSLETRGAILQWLREEFASALSVSAEKLDPSARFNEYGLDSRRATGLIGRLSERFERPFSPTLVWVYPTLEALASYLSGDTAEHGRGAATSSGTSVSEGEPIAMIGMACRLPGGASSPEQFWALLRDGVNTVREVPQDRWSLAAYYDKDPSAPGKMSSRWGGFIEHVDEFDPLFFGISPREAIHMDPQQRLALEVSWEALEDAFVVPGALRGSRTGVFIGAMWSDYGRLFGGRGRQIDQFSATGQDTSIIAGRVSYALGLQGPSMLVNTACSSSLVALHLACQSLQRGESTLALAGGVSLILSPLSTIMMSKFGAMSRDGRCKAFDARADGYVRGEGCGIVVLKPQRRAILDGDRIYCLIRGSAVNNDGFSNGLTAPNPMAQEEVLREAYARAGVTPAKVHYVEAHGPGTVLGDPIEAGALGAILGQGRPEERPLLIGSVKTNLGHLEAAAGIAGLIKTALSLRHRSIPKTLHFEEPNPHIPFEALHIKVQRELTPWPWPEEPAVAGVSSFGFSGTNCHVVLEAVPEGEACAVALSARSAEELETRARDLLAIAASERAEDLGALWRAATLRAGTDRCRLAEAAPDPSALFERLAARASGGSLALARPESLAGVHPRIVFVCPGQGSQWLGMGRALLSAEPVFRAKIAACDEAIRPLSGFSVIEQLLSDAERSRLHDVDVVQPVLFSIQVALGALWRSFGIEPDAVIGHSMGEVAAAHVASILSLEDAARVICSRSRLARQVSGEGAMAVIDLPAEEAARVVAERADALSVAAYNGPRSTVLSGDAGALEALLVSLSEKGVNVAKVNVTFASHSPQVDKLRGALLEALQDLKPSQAAVQMISTVTVQRLSGPECDAEYWFQNLRQPVCFTQAIGGLLQQGEALFIELSPHPILVKSIEAIAEPYKKGATLALPSLRRQEDDRAVLLETLSALYERGSAVSWQRALRGHFARRPASIDALDRAMSPGGKESAPEATAATARPVILPLSTRSAKALKRLARSYQELFAGEPASLEDIAWTASLRRSHHDHRLAVVGSSWAELASGLDAFLRDASHSSLSSGQVVASARPKVVFVFPGQGSQWEGMGRKLFEDEPAFRSALERCDAAIRAAAGWSLLDVLYADPARPRLDEVDVIQPCIFAIQVALAALFRSFGVHPDAVVGHSMGEVAAACVAGALSLDDAVRIICTRSRLAKRTSGRGAMAVVDLSSAEALEAIAGLEDRLSVAAINGPTTTLLSGEPEALDRVLSRLSAKDVFCRPIKVDYASHSPQMDLLRGELLRELEGVRPEAATVAILSTVTGEWSDGQAMDAAYWFQNLRAPVQLFPAVQTLLAESYGAFIEVSPHPVLAPSLEQAIRHAGKQARVVTSLRRDQGERAEMLSALGALYCLGLPVDFAAVYPEGGRVVPLPAYPWQRTRCWIDPAEAALEDTTAAAIAESSGRHPFLARHLGGVEPGSDAYWEVDLGLLRFPYLSSHRVGEVVVLPGTAYLEMALAAAEDAFGPGSFSLIDVRFLRALFLSPGEDRTVKISFISSGPSAAKFRIHSRPAAARPGAWELHVTGDVERTAPAVSAGEGDAESIGRRLSASLDPSTFYERLHAIGVQYGPKFQAVRALRYKDHELLGEIALPSDVAPQASRYRFHPILLDASLQIMAAPLVLEADAARRSSPFMPTHIERVRFFGRPIDKVLSHARLSKVPDGSGAGIVGDTRLLSESGELIAEIQGITFELLEFKREPAVSAADWLYEMTWTPATLEDTGTDQRRRAAFIVFATAEAAFALGREALGAARCIRVEPGSGFARLAADHYTLRADEPGDFTELLRAVRSDGGPALSGVLYLGAAADPTPDQLSLVELHERSKRACLSAALFVRALDELSWQEPPKVWLVTRGSQRVHEGDPVTGLTGAPLWGLGSSMAVEHPAFFGGMLDLDPGGSPREDAAALRAVTAAGGRRKGSEESASLLEDRLAIRKGAAYAARLARRAPLPAAPALHLRADASYLITGGLGDLGLKVAKWMAQHGARHLLLLGRTGLPSRERWSAVPAESAEGRRIAAIVEIERLGSSVQVVSGDVAEAATWRRLLEDQDRACRPPITGVIHAAGVLKPSAITATTKEDLEAQLRPKVQGSWALCQAFEERPLELFVVFSSGSTLLSSPFLGAYAAANSFLDALVHHRQARGLAGLSVNWGFWEEGGMAVRDLQKLGSEDASRGMESFTPAEALEILGRLITSDASQVGVMPIRWREWFTYHPEAGRAPLLSKLRDAGLEPADSPAATKSLRAEIAALDQERALSFMLDFLVQQVGLVLRLSPEELPLDQPLGGMGLDSLMAVELRNRLEKALDATLSVTMVWNYPTVRSLAPYLLERVKPTESAAPPHPPPPEPAARASAASTVDIDDLSDEEAERLLLAELDSLKRDAWRDR